MHILQTSDSAVEGSEPWLSNLSSKFYHMARVGDGEVVLTRVVKEDGTVDTSGTTH